MSWFRFLRRKPVKLLDGPAFRVEAHPDFMKQFEGLPEDVQRKIVEDLHLLSEGVTPEELGHVALGDCPECRRLDATCPECEEALEEIQRRSAEIDLDEEESSDE